MTRDERRVKCIEAMLDAFFDMQRQLGYEPRQDHPDPRICLTAAFDSLDPVAVVRSRRGLERYHDELTNPPEAMTRDEHRKKCIETMAEASANQDCTFSVWDTLCDASKEAYRREQAAAFDSLPSAGVRVNPIEATKEMRSAAYEEEQREGMTAGSALVLWRAMSSAGDLTNAEEKKT